MSSDRKSCKDLDSFTYTQYIPMHKFYVCMQYLKNKNICTFSIRQEGPQRIQPYINIYICIYTHTCVHAPLNTCCLEKISYKQGIRIIKGGGTKVTHIPYFLLLEELRQSNFSDSDFFFCTGGIPVLSQPSRLGDQLSKLPYISKRHTSTFCNIPKKKKLPTSAF